MGDCRVTGTLCFAKSEFCTTAYHCVYRFLQLVNKVRSPPPCFHVVENCSNFPIRSLQSILNSQSITSQTIRTFQVIHQG